MTEKKQISPRSLLADLRGRTNVVLIFFNTLWLFSDRILRMIISLFVGAWVARYLAPSQYGIFNNALAITSLCAALSLLGLESIVIRELVKKPNEHPQILGTAVILRLAMAGAIAIGTVVIVGVLPAYSENSVLKWLVYVLSVGMIFQSFEIIDCYFQSQVKSKYTVVAKNVAYLLASMAKVLFIVAHFPLIYFGCAWTFELVLGAAGLVVAYRSTGLDIRIWRFDWKWARFLLLQSWPLYVAYSAAILYMKMDQIMIGSILDSRSAGIFAAATKLYEIPFTIVIIASTSFFPALVQLYERDHRLFFRRYAQITWAYSVIGLVIAVVVWGFGRDIIRLLYGIEFSQAYSVVVIQMIGLIFFFNAGLRSSYLAISGQQRVIMVTSLFAAVANISLNFFLIPRLGIQGAAIATGITQCLALLFSNVFFKSTERIFVIQLKSLFLIPAWRKDGNL